MIESLDKIFTAVPVEAIVFWFSATVCVLSALLIVLNKNPLFSAIWLVINFFFLAIIFLLLSAQFLAIIQILVYAGAIMVFFLFVIMFIRLEKLTAKEALQPFSKLLLASLILLPICFFSYQLVPEGLRFPALIQDSFGSMRAVAKDLLYTQVLAFELISLLLLLAIVGGIVLAKWGNKSQPKTKENN